MTNSVLTGLPASPGTYTGRVLLAERPSAVAARFVAVLVIKTSGVDWCLLDGSAITLHDHNFDASAWRNHLNIYVNEHALPWTTTERELTVPPFGSRALGELLEFIRTHGHVHLVPAGRYYTAGFERKPVVLPSGRCIRAATCRGCSQIWSYKSAELLKRRDEFGDDLERIIQERLERLNAAISGAGEADVRKRLLLLHHGYQAAQRRHFLEAKVLFGQAAGRS